MEASEKNPQREAWILGGNWEIPTQATDDKLEESTCWRMRRKHWDIAKTVKSSACRTTQLSVSKLKLWTFFFIFFTLVYSTLRSSRKLCTSPITIGNTQFDRAFANTQQAENNIPSYAFHTVPEPAEGRRTSPPSSSSLPPWQGAAPRGGGTGCFGSSRAVWVLRPQHGRV